MRTSRGWRPGRAAAADHGAAEDRLISTAPGLSAGRRTSPSGTPVPASGVAGARSDASSARSARHCGFTWQRRTPPGHASSPVHGSRPFDLKRNAVTGVVGRLERWPTVRRPGRAGASRPARWHPRPSAAQRHRSRGCRFRASTRPSWSQHAWQIAPTLDRSVQAARSLAVRAARRPEPHRPGARRVHHGGGAAPSRAGHGRPAVGRSRRGGRAGRSAWAPRSADRPHSRPWRWSRAAGRGRPREGELSARSARRRHRTPRAGRDVPPGAGRRRDGAPRRGHAGALVARRRRLRPLSRRAVGPRRRRQPHHVVLRAPDGYGARR